MYMYTAWYFLFYFNLIKFPHNIIYKDLDLESSYLYVIANGNAIFSILDLLKKLEHKLVLLVNLGYLESW